MRINNIQKILSKYNIQVKEVLPFEKGYRNKSYPIILEDSTKVNLVLYKNETGIFERIQRTNLVSNYLAEKGFPTRRAYSICHAGPVPASLSKSIIKVKFGERSRNKSGMTNSN